jgi:hypothetical protein
MISFLVMRIEHPIAPPQSHTSCMKRHRGHGVTDPVQR